MSLTSNYSYNQTRSPEIATLYHPSLESPFLLDSYISYVDKLTFGRYDVTKGPKELVRFIVALCSDRINQLVMFQDLMMIGGDPRATLKEKELTLLAAEIFMIVPNKIRAEFYQELSNHPKFLKIFAKAVKENISIHASLGIGKNDLSFEEFENRKKTALVMCAADVVCLTNEQLLLEQAYGELLSKRFP